jgi:DEAD/DEAH box helicase domain-containing protein
MSSTNYYQSILSTLADRASESTVSILGITNKDLRQHLIEELNGNDKKTRFIADPVFEATFGWEKGDKTMDDLVVEGLLTNSLVNAMHCAKNDDFPRNRRPFRHQLEAWRTLTNTRKSVVVTSGTGSGKTECFMVPILNDIATEIEESAQQIEGVRALFIYPLNALINSQRERLRAWTESYGEKLRFCLYNGNTEESKHVDQTKFPNEVLTRKKLRESPPPILVTNATMLEYMLIRQIDEPIIKRSYGKLRWIVLDEAHSYVGSQAAELSLLMRRVLHTFGVESKDVRFVATSATIGDGKASAQLQTYLANLAGISTDQVLVIGGKRDVPEIPRGEKNTFDVTQLSAIDDGVSDSETRYQLLAGNEKSRKLRDFFVAQRKPITLDAIAANVFASADGNEALKWIDVCSHTVKPAIKTKNAVKDSEPFLPLRAHLFQQVLNGIWCCTDSKCNKKIGTRLEKGWPFGRVYTQRRLHCECGAPVLELVFCTDCNAPYLHGIGPEGEIKQKSNDGVDEFSIDSEVDEEEPDSSTSSDQSPKKQPSINDKFLSPKLDELGGNTCPHSIDGEGKIVGSDVKLVNVNLMTHPICVECGHTNGKTLFYRRALLGVPFFIGTAAPTLLDACQESDDASDRPFRGKRLITFTDSRQGTARISIKLQQDSERNSVRSIIYHGAANNLLTLPTDVVEEKNRMLSAALSKANTLRSSDNPDNPDISAMAADYEANAAKLYDEIHSLGKGELLSWNDAINRLERSDDIGKWALDYYKILNADFFNCEAGARTLSEIFLLREFSRRPKRQNSLETLGLVAVEYPALELITKTPFTWESLSLTLEDWKSYLKVILDFYIRENSIINIQDGWTRMMGAKIFPKTVVKYDSKESTSSRIYRWPLVGNASQHRLVRLLIAACNLDIKNTDHIDRINECLSAAWTELTKVHTYTDIKTNTTQSRQILIPSAGKTLEFHLARAEISFKNCTEAWICPITNRLLDSTFKGISPYLPNKCSLENITCRKISLVVYKEDSSTYASENERKSAASRWISSQPEIQALRSENLWTDISDKVVQSSGFFRAAEHSAQQPASKLKTYEAQFKTGKVNVLCCSTTMEMGVDIGGLSVVAMNNVPPHPANYLQRAGRAGRRGETKAVAFTMCKDNPHERNVFNDPLWPFTTAIKAPYITLNSERIVQRHINALLLSTFLKEISKVTETEVTSLTCNWFFNGDDVDSPAEKMSRWLHSMLIEVQHARLEYGIQKIIKGSILASSSHQHIIERAIKDLRLAKNSWLPEYIKLSEELKKLTSVPETDPYKRKVEIDLNTLGKEYLLSVLAAKAFLPGYGFPTGIVTFDHYSVSDYKSGKYVKASGRIDNRTRMKERPARDVAVAIREYAPGAEVVIDGLVYKSAGILLNTFSPDSSPEGQIIKKEWRCRKCGDIGNCSSSGFSNSCDSCGAELYSDDVREYIEPAGFAVEWQSSPKNDVSTQTYIPVEQPWVTAKAELVPLFQPLLGSLRASSQGHIFSHSAGLNGTGYAICLICGKAESMPLKGDDSLSLKAGKHHNRLQGKANGSADPRCEGSDEQYAIKAGIHLGATDQTDVFELYLKDPTKNTYLKHEKNDQLMWTLAVALRQALADCHGVNSDEIGYTVKPTMLLGCNYPVATIALYDTAGGGAGFSSQAPKHLEVMLKTARKYLDCVAECKSACQSCLIGYDTRFYTELLNRHLALDYLAKALPFLEMPTEAKLFKGTNTYCAEALSSEILAKATAGAKHLKLFTNGKYKDWNISAGNLKDACLTWKNYFDMVELVLPTADLSTLDSVDKEDLYALSKMGISLSIVQTAISNDVCRGTLLAQAINGDAISGYSVTSFGVSKNDANIPSEGWWDTDTSYRILTGSLPTISTVNIDPSQFLPDSGSGDIEVELTTACDGKLEKFGDYLWEQLLESCALLQKLVNSDVELVRISYSDAYISSPWTVMLFAEVINSLKLRLGHRWSVTEVQLSTGAKPASDRYPGVYAEWADINIRKSVIQAYFSYTGLEIDACVIPMSDIAHGRVLSLEWDNGCVTYIRFDHGFGCWSANDRNRTRLNLNASPEEQVKNLVALQPVLAVRFSKKFPTQIFIKHRGLNLK